MPGTGRESDTAILSRRPLASINRARALLQVAGCRYRNSDAGIDTMIDSTGRHTASYNLTYQEDQLGELTLHFNRRVDEEILNTAEDLIALVMPAIRNALRYRAALMGGQSTPGPRTANRPARGDSLMLVQIDDLPEIRERDGETGARSLMATTREQLTGGLRDADSVFQIDDETLAVLLPGTTADQALAVAKKLRVLIASLHLKDGNVSQQLTACMGIAESGTVNAAEAVLDRARAALTRALREGPNSLRCEPV